MNGEVAPRELITAFCALHSPLKDFGYQLFRAATDAPSVLESIGEAMSGGERFFIAFDAMPGHSGLLSQASIVSIGEAGQLTHHVAFKLDAPHSSLEAGHV